MESRIQNESLIDFFEGEFKKNPGPVTIIGSGGKTSLIWYLARHFSAGGKRARVLVTPTTKMLVPDKPVPGVTMAGIFNKETGKLESLPPGELEKIYSQYDFVFIEGDGSRGLPIKAWADHEPVVPVFTAITVGLIPLWPLGLAVSEKLVHRLPLFLELSGAREGEILNVEHLARVIPGLFRKAQGKKILFINQIEDDAALEQARKFAALLQQEPLCIIAGSVKKGSLALAFSPE
ncbi:hydroxylase accessory protein YqeC [Spirochaetia bacterium]|nr:hydroxylase accessory protein YqeC [Spirochaetia bacterium]